MKAHNYRNLKIWIEGIDLVNEIYDLSNSFPKENRFDITTQILRAAVSIPSNIAEGSSRSTNRDFQRFLDYAIGSAYELETQLQICEMRKFSKEESIQNAIRKTIKIQKMMSRFKYSLKV